MTVELPGRRRWIDLALAASVVLNLFLGGVLIGRGFAGERPSPPFAGARLGAGLAARARALPLDQRLKLASAFQSRRADIRAARAELRMAGEEARGAMAAEPYDPIRAQTAFARVRAATEHLQAHMQAGLADALPQLSPSSRTALAGPSREP